MPKFQTHWRWYLSALFYRFSYIQISHQVDDDVFAYLGERVAGAVAADCGCGPGFVAEKFLRRGAVEVLAIDVNPTMLDQASRRLAPYIANGQVKIICQEFSTGLFKHLKGNEEHTIDIILFKRSLYNRPEKAMQILSAASSSLAPEGILLLIHPERSLRRYAFGPKMQIKSHTLYHLFNRTISLFADWMGIGHYTIYDEAELLQMVRIALPHFQVNSVSATQSAFNIVAAHAPASHIEKGKKK